MSEGLIRNRAVKLLLVVIILSPLAAVHVPALLAAGIDLDGVVVETEWTLWFNDGSQQPYFDVYWHEDSENLYIAILTNDANDNSDVLQLAFKAENRDYWIEIKPGDSTIFRVSGGSWDGYWKRKHTGLPSGVNAVAGKTDGKRSYEVSIELSILKDKASIPDRFPIWLMVLDGAPEGQVNYYPDSYADWWFAHGSEDSDDFENPPLFHIPELSLGTITALASMLAALTLFAYKRPTIIK